MYEGPLAMTQKSPIRVFHSLYKVGINGIIGIQGFNSCKKNLTSNGDRPNAREYYWFKSPIA